MNRRTLLKGSMTPALLRAAGIGPVGLAAGLLGGGSTRVLAQDEATPAPNSSTVFIRQHLELGPYFTDPTGRTLYMFANDTEPGVSTCVDDCAGAWPPFAADGDVSLPMFVEGELTTFARDDGTMQVAYNGMPLYYWAKDQAAGDVTGQGVGGIWFVVTPGQQMGAVATPAAEAEAEGTPVASPMAAGEVAVEVTEMAVLPAATVFRAGSAYTFAVSNTGEFTHELLIEPAGAIDEPLEADGAVAEVEDIEAATTKTLDWTFDEPGVYQLACHIRDHYAMGMVITITVVE